MRSVFTKLKKCAVLILVVCNILNFIPIKANAADNSVERYTVLVLDTTSFTDFKSNGEVIYVADPALDYVKDGALKFVEDIGKAKGTNHVAIVEFTENTANVVQDFTTDIDLLVDKISNLQANGSDRSISKGLDVSYGLLSSINNINAQKNIVLFSTGLTDCGNCSYSGKYSEDSPGSPWLNENTGMNLYAYANVAYASAEKIKKDLGATIYSIGFFDMYDGMPAIGQELVEFFKMCAADFATDYTYFYEVEDAEEIKFAFSNISNDILYETIEGTFRYPGKVTDKESADYKKKRDFEAAYRYSDSYFIDSAYEYNGDLAFMSMCLAWSAFGSNETRSPNDLEIYGPDYSKYSQNVERLMTEIGFEYITPNEYYNVKPTMDSVGAIAGHKIITDGEKDYTLIALAVRGGGYESEWSSNVTLGKSGQHQGFEEARDIVLDFLKDYIKDNNIKGDVKLWITGYSRAAATTNLTAAELDVNAKSILGTSVNLTPENIYAYCLEAPQGTLTTIDNNDELYKNIFCIINPVDFVTKVAMTEFYFTHFGKLKHLPSERTDTAYEEKRNKMLEIYYSLKTTEDYVIDNFTAININLSSDENNPDSSHDVFMDVYLNEYMGIIARDVLETRENYVKEFQDSLREVCYILLGSLTSDPQKVDSFIDALMNKINQNIIPLAWYKATDSELAMAILLKELIVSAAVETNITNYNEKDIGALAEDLGEILFNLISQPSYLATFVRNFKSIIEAHKPELCYSWLASDVNIETNGDYRVIHINCPVDVLVYDSSNNFVSKIENDKPIDLSNGNNYAYINFDDTKVVVLPVNEDYRLEITATDIGEVDVSVKEFSAEIGTYSSLENYYDIPISTGDILTLIVPEVPFNTLSDSTANGTGAVYSLFDMNNNELTPNLSLLGNEAKQATYTVTVNKNIEEAGAVMGSGSKQIGEYAKLEAFSAEGYVFEGWYENNALLSSEAIVRIRVENDRIIEAKFSKINLSDTNSSSNTTQSTNNVFKETPSRALLFVPIIFMVAFALVFQYNKKKRNTTK